VLVIAVDLTARRAVAGRLGGWVAGDGDVRVPLAGSVTEGRRVTICFKQLYICGNI
jgi:hypothetical protein